MPPYTLKRLLWAGPLATLIAIVANFVYFLVTKAFGEMYMLPQDANGDFFVPMPALMPVLLTLFAGLLAALFFGLLIRYSRNPVTVFLSVAITALILSFGASFGMPYAKLHTKILLSGMNVLTALVMAGGILYFGKKRTTRQSSLG